jgi:hypothetical protein
MASVHLGTQDSPLREIMWLEIWAKKVMALAGNPGDYSHRSAYDETRRCLFAASRSPFVIARPAKDMLQIIVRPWKIRHIIAKEKSWEVNCQSL